MSATTNLLNPYAKFLNGQEPLAVLPNTPGKLKALAQKIGPGRMTTPPAPGKWSPRDILCHLADCEIAFAFRLRQTLAEDHHTVQPFDQDRWSTPYSGIDANEALATFSLLRRWNVLLIEAALPQNAAKPVKHPERGEMTFSTIV
ncbi:MAG TPA: DinB family protein, partial [Acidobacteriaceae bacterium]|nr:DinB family protein [Acidobacteriaceae bacterium]